MVLKRDRIIVLLSLALITALSWAYVSSLASNMQNSMNTVAPQSSDDMQSMENATSDSSDTQPSMDISTEIAMPQLQAWGVTDIALIFVMWAVMMVAMMTPSAAPMILMFAGVNRRRKKQQASSYVPTSVFLVGYLVVWAAFSVLATSAQWGLHALSLLSPMMVSTSPVLGGILLVVAGIYQLTPLKHACLRNCRSPLGFVLNEWRVGWLGAFRMGLKHGGYCTGCCWSLMSLLFVAGVMNLVWVAAIAGFILIEKLAPMGHRVGQGAGVLLAGWGALLIGGVF
jgi:predicted metal-binding membrane protein